MSISRHVKQMMQESSWIRKMFEQGILLKKQHGQDKVFDFSLGNPIMEPPPEFVRALEKVVRDTTAGMHRYMPNAGYMTTRAVVAERLAAETGLPFTANHVLMSCGAGGGLNVILKTLLDAGDEVAIFEPYFPEYPFYVSNASGTTVVIPTDEHFDLDLDELERRITARTKVVLYNSPNNPTGVVYSEDSLRALGALLDRKQCEFGRSIYLICDDPYKRIVYGDARVLPVFDVYRNSIEVYSHSKDLGLAGERIGFVAVHPEADSLDDVVAGMTLSNRILGFINAPAMMQHVLREIDDVTVDIAAYERKRDRFYSALVDMGYEVVAPGGAFYLFPKTLLEDDVEFVSQLQKRLVLTVPGRGFGRPGHMRISYCVDDDTIERALPIFEQVAREFVEA